MLHPDVEARVGAHHIFSALLIPSSNHPRHEVSSLRSGFLYQPRRWHSNTASASITALLEKLRREKDGTKADKCGNSVHDDFKEKDIAEEDWKQGRIKLPPSDDKEFIPLPEDKRTPAGGEAPKPEPLS